MFSGVKGTQDIIDSRLFDGVIARLVSHVTLYNFSHMQTPILESVSLFKRSIGEHTDVVGKEMFILEQKSSKEQLCLRPEGTAGAMRAFLEHQHALPLPCKTYSYGPMFRYERPQKGRYRQFHHFNIEALGIKNVAYDALFISMLYKTFTDVFLLENFVLEINFLGTAQDRVAFKTALYDFLTAHQTAICQTCQERKETNILRVFDCKIESCQQLYTKAPQLVSYLCQESQAEWDLLRTQLAQLSVSFVHNPRLVRGLDYYNKTVFEFIGFDLGAQSTFCGGGRYDGLAEQLGSKAAVPALGAAIGLERLMMLLEAKKEQFEKVSLPLACIISCAQEQNNTALLLADFLQSHGICIDALVDDESLKAKFKKAERLKATLVLVVGADEQQGNYVTVKNMSSGTQEKISQHELVTFLQKHKS